MNRHKITSLPRTSNGKSRIDTPKAYNFESLTSKRNNYGLYKISKAESPPSQSKKKKRKREKSYFLGLTCLPTTPPIPTTHFTPPYLPSLAGSLISILFSFFSFSLIHSSLLLYPLSPVLPHHHHHYFHHHFPTRSPENSWEPINTFTSFFEVKISNLFSGFYIFAWGYFYLNFNNDTHVVYEHWKWYLCVCMYGFCIGGIIWWVGIWFVLMMTT